MKKKLCKCPKRKVQHRPLKDFFIVEVTEVPELALVLQHPSRMSMLFYRSLRSFFQYFTLQSLLLDTPYA